MPGRILPGPPSWVYAPDTGSLFFLLLPGCPAVRAPFWDVRCVARLGSGGVRPVPRGAAATRCSAFARRRPTAAAAGVADRRRLREEAVIAAKVANALRARLAARRLEIVVASTAAPTPPRSAPAPPAPTSCSSSRGAARSARRTPRCRRRAASSSRSPTPTRSGSRTRCAQLAAAVRRPGGRLRLRPGAFVQRGGHQPGRPVLALRDVAAGAGVGAGVASPAATARSTPCAARPTRGRPGHGPRPRVPVQHGQARLPRGLRARRRARRRRWSRRSRASGRASGG